MKSTAIAGLLFCLLPPSAQAWGERGHHSICFVSSRLVQEPGLNRFFSHKGDVLGHLCTVPDIVWKASGDKVAYATHFVNPDRFSVPIDEIPRSFPEYAKKASPVPAKSRKEARKMEKAIAETGTAWWRAEQLYRVALAAARRVGAAPKPEKKDLQSSAHPYNRAVYEMMVAMGVLGHFVADLAMPYHNTRDYDGRESGHSGIHFFYETEVVNALGLDLQARIGLRAAQVQVPVVTGGDEIFKKMTELSKLSLADLPKIKEADTILGTEIVEGATRPKRAAPADAVKRFDDLIVTQLARAARILANIWDAIYREAGKPDLSAYRSYRYPFQPDFIPLDYLSK